MNAEPDDTSDDVCQSQIPLFDDSLFIDRKKYHRRFATRKELEKMKQVVDWPAKWTLIEDVVRKNVPF